MARVSAEQRPGSRSLHPPPISPHAGISQARDDARRIVVRESFKGSRPKSLLARMNIPVGMQLNEETYDGNPRKPGRVPGNPAKFGEVREKSGEIRKNPGNSGGIRLSPEKSEKIQGGPFWPKGAGDCCAQNTSDPTDKRVVSQAYARSLGT